MSITLYRKMCEEEAKNTIKMQKILPATNELADKRKWFTTTPFVSCWSHNPYFTGSSIILKIEVDEEYFEKVLSVGSELKSGFKDIENPYVFVKVHSKMPDLYNIGVVDLDELNSHVRGITKMQGTYEEVLQEEILGTDLHMLERDYKPLEYDEFYIQVPYDVAIMMLRYQTIIREAVFFKVAHLSKNLKYLERVNFGRGVVTLKIQFDQNVQNMGLFSEVGFMLDKEKISSLESRVEKVSLVEIKEVEFSDSKNRFLGNKLGNIVKGDNDYTLHHGVEFKGTSDINLDDYETITTILLSGKFQIDSVRPYIGIINDLENIMQVDCGHIDSLKTYIEKSIRFSNFVINYLSEMAISFSKDEIIRIKWELLLNNLGKPYCDDFSEPRYAQFRGNAQYYNKIVSSMFIDDFGFDLKAIHQLVEANPLLGKKKLNSIRKNLLKRISEYYGCDEEKTLEILMSYIKVAFAIKLSQYAAIKPSTFSNNLVNTLGFIKNWADMLWDYYGKSLNINYEELYFDYRKAYSSIVVDYYLEKKKSTRDMVWGILESDYNDLSIVYEKMNGYIHHLDDNVQIDYDYLIGNYFRDGDELVKKYFNSCITEETLAHGDSHASRVGVYCYLLGKLYNLSDEDIAILLEASTLHDKGRVNDDEDTVHGLESVKLVQKSKLLPKTVKNRRYIYFLMESHSLLDEKETVCMDKYNLNYDRAHLLYQIFKDADALDRVRFDTLRSHASALNVKFFRTKYAKFLVKFAYLLNAQYKMNKRALNPSIKRLFLK